MRLDVLWQFMQVDMEADRFENKMRQSENRQKLIKQRNFLMEQQANMKKLENDVAVMQDRLEAVRDEAERLEKVLGNGFFGEERDEVAYLWANAYDPHTRIVQMDLTFFCREESGLYRRFAETHRQRAHRPEELTARLREAGFGQIKVFGDRTFEPPKPDEMRIHFLAVRE